MFIRIEIHEVLGNFKCLEHHLGQFIRVPTRIDLRGAYELVADFHVILNVFRSSTKFFIQIVDVDFTKGAHQIFIWSLRAQYDEWVGGKV